MIQAIYNERLTLNIISGVKASRAYASILDYLKINTLQKIKKIYRSLTNDPTN